MDKSVAATNENEKVSNDNIPDDLVFSILSKLPLKSLKRFGRVCKSWSLLFENPHFMNMYRSNFMSKSCKDDDTSLLLKQIVPHGLGSTLYLLSGERFENKVKIDWPPPFQNDDSCLHILDSGSVNGTLGILREISTRVVLWNPATEEFKVVPPSPSESVLPYQWPFVRLQGFGYDHFRDDYKVIWHVIFSPLTEYDLDHLGLSWDSQDWEDISYPPLWEIYSLRSNSWRKLDAEMPPCVDNSPAVRVYLDGVCHWLGANRVDNNFVVCLVSFDLANEVFFITPMPSGTVDSFAFGSAHSLTVLNGSIAFISNHVQTTIFQISILGELNVKESWTKLFTVGPLPCIKYSIDVIGAGKKGIFFRGKK